MSRIESSSTGISEADLDRLLELYDVPPEQAARLRALAPAARPRGWWDAYADTLSSGYASLIRTEAGSRSLQCYCALVPHALLQTPDVHPAPDPDVLAQPVAHRGRAPGAGLPSRGRTCWTRGPGRTPCG